MAQFVFFTLISNALAMKGIPANEITEIMKKAIQLRPKEELPTFTPDELIALDNDRLGKITSLYTLPKIYKLSSYLRESFKK